MYSGLRCRKLPSSLPARGTAEPRPSPAQGELGAAVHPLPLQHPAPPPCAVETPTDDFSWGSHCSPLRDQLGNRSVPTAASMTHLDVPSLAPSHTARPPQPRCGAAPCRGGRRGPWLAKATSPRLGTYPEGAPEGPGLTCHPEGQGGPRGPLQRWGHSPDPPGTFGKALPGRAQTTSALALPHCCPSAPATPPEHDAPTGAHVVPREGPQPEP